MPAARRAGLALVTVLAASGAWAQEPAAPCGPRALVAATLTARYGEALRFVGLIDATSVVEVWASEVTGSWTLLVTRASGGSCAVFVGAAAAFGPPPPDGPAGRGG